MQKLSVFDKLIVEVDRALRVVTGDLSLSTRPTPAADLPEAPLTPAEQQHVGGLMRINHAGEVCAQALYQGQALTAELKEVRVQMEFAAIEEWDHLAWCEQRLMELNSHTSYLNPVWYVGAFSIGAFAGLIGDRWSLAFVAETERQVVKHLEEHQARLPAKDQRSLAILTQMQIEEEFHGQSAKEAGAAEFPRLVQWAMSKVSKIMTTTSYYI